MSFMMHRTRSSIMSFNAGSDATHRKGLKIQLLSKCFKKLSIALAQVKSGNTSGNSLNEIPQIIYSLYRSKEVTKKVYNNIMNSIKV